MSSCSNRYLFRRPFIIATFRVSALFCSFHFSPNTALHCYIPQTKWAVNIAAVKRFSCYMGDIFQIPRLHASPFPPACVVDFVIKSAEMFFLIVLLPTLDWFCLADKDLHLSYTNILCSVFPTVLVCIARFNYLM